MTQKNTTNTEAPSASAREERRCSHCGFPIRQGDTGLRHYGLHTAHSELECLRLLHAEIDRLLRSSISWSLYARFAESQWTWFQTAFRELLADLDHNHQHPAGPKRQIDLDAAREKLLGPKPNVEKANAF
ncbi:hypothetical protein [Piscinibacter defluvii]|uniref:hypothetical protein n=1 Tax=Piscinibacter defluvii TaxID=1796922 RepID=UPI000FDD247E|nr:hypothetical protein [Piscinibacter defluvii]